MFALVLIFFFNWFGSWKDPGFTISLFVGSRFPDDDRFAPPIGNGYLATNVFSDAIYVDGVFNGYREDSHRARIPSTASIRVNDDVISEDFSLDMWNGMIWLQTRLIDSWIGDLNFAVSTVFQPFYGGCYYSI